MPPYKYVGAYPDELANGRPVAYGDVAQLTRREVGANARLIDAGRLVLEPKPQKPTTKENDR